jgi:lysophospholipase L1-like esterase
MKHLDKVRTETYSGANIAAMKYHIKPCLESQPDKIILHVGTNDIGNKEATEIAEGTPEI